MSSELNLATTCARHPAGSSSLASSIPAGSCDGTSLMIPVTPSTMTSGTEPRRSATTGVPQAMDSITTMPNGSSQQIGNSIAQARDSRSRLAAASATPNSSVSFPSRGLISCSR
jgi:hypothetical protein